MFHTPDVGVHIVLLGIALVVALGLTHIITTFIESKYKDKTKVEGIKIVLYSADLFIVLVIFEVFPLLFSLFVIFGIVFLYLFWKLTIKLK